jgi:tetratricopeptide (TPR) repeat protein
MVGWLGDLGRLSWGLIYWNVRKALFRLRGASGAAPCQHPSDSGLANETGCEACIGWRDAGRFRRMCPLLAAAADGRRVCSVNAADVRPFWGRALLYYGGALAVAGLVAVAATFAGFRAIGYRVPLHVIAWPPAWHQVHQARADYFYRMALRTLAAGDVRQSFLALSQVYTLDPDNIDAARLLAEFTQVTNPDFSDSIYSRLVLGRRGNYEETAQIWLRALLSRGDFASAGGLAGEMLREGGKHAPAWTQAVLFAEKMTGDGGEVDRLLAGPGKIPDEARSVLSLARTIRSGSADERLRQVERFLGGAATTFEFYYSLGRSEELGKAGDVVVFLEGRGGGMLDAYDRESLKLDAYSILGWHAQERSEIGLLLERGASASTVNLIAGHLVRYPDAASAGRVFELLGTTPLAASPENSGSHLALLCMAGVNGLDSRMKQEADIVGGIVGGAFPAWEHVREFFGSRNPRKDPAAILPALGRLPLEMVYALSAHYRASGGPAPAEALR